MTREIRGSVVVVTGASRGIGRATARLFAGRGAAVVLAAREADALQAAAAECEIAGSASGGRALAVPTDVGDAGAVEELARRAVERFGRIDVWVNNAVLLAFGRLEEVPAEANRRIVETNLLGYLHGARAVLPRFREQDSGVLVNVSSGFGLVGAPYIGAYSATKFAQRGLGQALRGELRGTGVEVCTIMPGAVDTPAYRLAANFTRRPVRPPGPFMGPEKVAREVLRRAERPRPEVTLGGSVRTLRLTHALSPRLAEGAVARGVEAGIFGGGQNEPNPGNLATPRPEWTDESGGINREAKRRAADTALPRSPTGRRLAAAAAAGVSALAPGLLAWLLLRRARDRN